MNAFPQSFWEQLARDKEQLAAMRDDIVSPMPSEAAEERSEPFAGVADASGFFCAEEDERTIEPVMAALPSRPQLTRPREDEHGQDAGEPVSKRARIDTMVSELLHCQLMHPREDEAAGQEEGEPASQHPQTEALETSQLALPLEAQAAAPGDGQPVPILPEFSAHMKHLRLRHPESFLALVLHTLTPGQRELLASAWESVSEAADGTFLCNFDGCEKVCKKLNNKVSHIREHTDLKANRRNMHKANMTPCIIAGCGVLLSYPKMLKAHVWDAHFPGLPEEEWDARWEQLQVSAADLSLVDRRRSARGAVKHSAAIDASKLKAPFTDGEVVFHDGRIATVACVNKDLTLFIQYEDGDKSIDCVPYFAVRPDTVSEPPASYARAKTIEARSAVDGEMYPAKVIGQYPDGTLRVYFTWFGIFQDLPFGAVFADGVTIAPLVPLAAPRIVEVQPPESEPLPMSHATMEYHMQANGHLARNMHGFSRAEPVASSASGHLASLDAQDAWADNQMNSSDCQQPLSFAGDDVPPPAQQGDRCSDSPAKPWADADRTSTRTETPMSSSTAADKETDAQNDVGTEVDLLKEFTSPSSPVTTSANITTVVNTATSPSAGEMDLALSSSPAGSQTGQNIFSLPPFDWPRDDEHTDTEETVQYDDFPHDARWCYDASKGWVLCRNDGTPIFNAGFV